MNLTILLLIAAIFVSPVSSGQIGTYNVVDFGSVGDGKTLNTKTIQSAIDVCHKAGGGTVYFPAGQFLSGTIYIKSNITLMLDEGAVLLGSTNLDDYPQTIPDYRSYTDNYTERSLIYAEKAENIAIVGKGILDGQGDLFTKEYLPYKNRPYMLRIVECKNVTIRDVTMRNSPMWVQHYLACENVVIDGITVKSRRANVNNDGIDIDSCDDVRISNCYIDTEDDAIVLKATSNRPCKNVTVTNCVLTSHCCAFKCGTESNGGFQDITVTNCTIFDTRMSGIALELVDGGELNRISISNITMTNVNNPIFIRLGNRARPWQVTSQHDLSSNTMVSHGLGKPGMGSMQNIIISNIQAIGAGMFNERDPLPIHRKSHDPGIGCTITGLPGHLINNVTLENIRITFAGGGTLEDYNREIPENHEETPTYEMLGITPAYGFYCRHVQNIRFRNIDLAFEKNDFRPALVFDDVQNLTIFNLSAGTSKNTPALIDLNNVKNALIQGCKPDEKTTNVLHVRGSESSGISIINNDKVNLWPIELREVEIKSPMDGKIQKAYFYASRNAKSQPLIVSLHTWSGNYAQNDQLVKQILEKDWNYIHPDFRGANNNPMACGSKYAIDDIDQAIDFAIRHGNVDMQNIHVIGVSGGGMATLLSYMDSGYPVSSFSAWVPISDLQAWYYQSIGRKNGYAGHILAGTGSVDSVLNVDEAIKRSPLYMETPTERRKDSRLFIYAGIHDGYEGSVPVSQSLNFYNKVIRDYGASNDKIISDKEILDLVSMRTSPALPNKKLGDRNIIYERNFKNISLILFEGKHEMLNDVALELLQID